MSPVDTVGPGPATLTPDELAREIRSMAVAIAMAGEIDNPLLMLETGRCLIGWSVRRCSGCLVFARPFGPADQIHLVAAVNAPETRRAEFQTDPNDPATTILMLG